MSSTNKNSVKPDENEVATPKTLLELSIFVNLETIINSWPSKALETEHVYSQSAKERLSHVCKSIHYDVHGLSILIDMLHQHGTQRNSVATTHDVHFISAVVRQYMNNIKRLYDFLAQATSLILLPQLPWYISVDSCRTLLGKIENTSERTKLSDNLTKLLQLNQPRFDAFQHSYHFVCHHKKDLQLQVRPGGYDMKKSIQKGEALHYLPLLPFLRDMTSVQ
ncbi:hypothetical protein B481_2740 [Planococcus halocryophilus Or1]|uniref:Uncharacterized protein n=1 Tax=Planococcus halocryophilus TaxID=1215089 RepID=A0A1C7DP98_9BACL|nr:hypothetical protein [Planococcus halocryophilus]ANU13316.1 hypothetical protein BBI08_05460 [Planococcus halocryophilus]EMF45897.1 hypothetical protein B481_2740 [Planococcus halocryophilus Or1]